MALYKVVVKKFAPGWANVHNAVRMKLELSLWNCQDIMQQRANDGSWTSAGLPTNAAMNWALAFEEADCEVDLVESKREQ